MADDDKKPEDEKPAEDADQPKDMKAAVEGAKKEGKSRLRDAYKEAMKKSFGETWTEKAQFWKWPKNAPLFVYNFFKELLAVKKEKEDTKDETESEIAAEVVKGSETFDIAERLAEGMDKEAEFDDKEEEAVALLTEDVLEATKATGEPEKAIKTIARVHEDAKNKKEKPEALTEEQMRLTFSTGLFTVVRLRERFDTEAKLTAFLKQVQSASAKSVKVKDLSLYLGNNFKKFFNFKEEQIPDLLGMDTMKFASLKISSFSGGLSGEEKMEKGLDIVLPEIFPTSVKDNGMPKMRKFFKRFVGRKSYPTPAEIAELTFMIDEDEMRDFAKRIGGAKVISLASVKATEARKSKLKEEREAKALAKKEAKKGEKKDAKTAKKGTKEDEPKLAEAA